MPGEKIIIKLFVDTAPVQDKLWAAEAGIGWQGKNTNILTRDFGSWIFLGELVMNIELEYDKLQLLQAIVYYHIPYRVPQLPAEVQPRHGRPRHPG